MTDQPDFFVRFWGVRGSLACPGSETQRYGGNTSCLEIRCGGRLLIFDAGTGLRKLGESVKGDGPLDADLFLTHTHLDHVVGLPFFAPFFVPGNRFRLWAGHLRPAHALKGVLAQMMVPPLFPVPPDIFRAEMTYNDFDAGTTLTPSPGVAIRTAPLNHPNGATGYRVEYGGRAICYVTDTEHYEAGRDPTVVELVRGADIVIYDCTYTDAEYPRFKGFGHSTWQEGLRVVETAGAGTLVVFHHDPAHDDEFMDALAAEAEAARPGTKVAREGMVLRA